MCINTTRFGISNNNKIILKKFLLLKNQQIFVLYPLFEIIAEFLSAAELAY